MKVARLGTRHSYRKDEYMLKIADMCTSVGILSSLSAIVFRENSVFGTETNHTSVFGTENFELPYLAST